ncbi:hypothetical protein [Aulosira sp. FACHB-615]|uniref:hypothetical protein n=1 Tax=Aulosira sp. FACHB-615 TaxID=2692777 RepID=UPI0016878724|nr:hypothetical protein [Aulosira sp. FACHB-615]MBD2490428.1 hypothetical protein [Aulosira sp. FACHB-615]
MADKDNLNDIIERILRGSQTDADIEKLRRSLKIVEGVLQLVSQNGEFNTNIGQITGGDIHLGDRTYQGADAATIQQIVRNIFQETKATQRPIKEESLLDNVKKEVKGRLTKSLFVENAKPINLKK